MVSEMVIGIYSDDLERSKMFYADLLGLVPMFDSDWVVQMTSPNNRSLNLTLQLRTHDTTPAALRKHPQGCSVAFIVPDVDAVFETANSMGLEIVKPPTNEEYGQRRFLTLDPSGLLVDVSANCEPSPEFVKKYMS